MRNLSLFVAIIISSVAYAQDQSNACVMDDTVHIVVLGSSTAAGSGPSSADSTWVNRFRKYVQNINPASTVTNLAIGGTTTYHIMPSWFTPPAGRPSPNPSNNVSQAITLGADAIIVNMPSNDAAQSFPVSEQMFNFQTIVSTADSAGIPVWICTTQPRNSFSAAQIQIQTDVRDSILAHFGVKAIDFWNGFNNLNNGLDSTYDSGDGVHMNDLAHGILFERVKAENILSYITDTATSTEHYIANLYYESSLECGDSSGQLVLVIGNTGLESSNLIQSTFEISDLDSSTSYNVAYNSTSALQACAFDTVFHNLSTYLPSNFQVMAYLNSLDTNALNDTSQHINVQSSGYPSVQANDDSLCFGNNAILNASASNADSVFWYDSFSSLHPIGAGSSFTLGNLQSDSTIYVESMKGNPFYTSSLATVQNTNVNFNGIMFDVIGKDSIVLDSIALKINSTGLQNVVIYTKDGTFSGSENTPGDWSVLDTIETNIATSGSFAMLNIPTVTLDSGDTMGIYMHMLSAGAQLSYHSNGTTGGYFSNSELDIISGSGIAHTFGTIYNPRRWSGEIHYHYGFNPQGNCNSNRIAVTAHVSDPQVSLGNDTTIFDSESLILDAGSNFSQYTWSTGDTTATLLVDSNSFAIGSHFIWVDVVDQKWLCNI